MAGERLLPEGTVLRIDPNADTEQAPALPEWSYRNRPDAPCPGAFVPKYQGGPSVRVLCSTPIEPHVGLCPRCSAIEVDVRRRLRDMRDNAQPPERRERRGAA